MTQTIYYTATTLDGYLADEDDSLEWLLTQEIDPAGPMNYAEFIDGIGAIVMGRTTYEWVRGHIESEDDRWAYVVPTFVFTHAELSAAEEADIRFVAGDVATVHPALVEAAGGRNVWVVGGGDLAAQFAEAGLLDTVMVSIAPVTLGAGRPLFPRRFDLELKTLERNGAFACAVYAVVGPRSN